MRPSAVTIAMARGADSAVLRVMLVLLIPLASSVAQAEKRVAIVIYKHAGVLLNPMNDAADVATS